MELRGDAQPQPRLQILAEHEIYYAQQFDWLYNHSIGIMVL